MEAEVCRLSGQLEAVDREVVEAEEAVARSSERMRQANAEFSSLMAAMSVAFREYDQAVSIELCFHAVRGTAFLEERGDRAGTFRGTSPAKC